MHKSTNKAIEILNTYQYMFKGTDYCCILDALEALGRYEDAEEENIVEYADISKIDPNMTTYTVPNRIPPIIRADKVEEFLNTDNSEALQRSVERLKKFSHIVTDNTKKVGD